LVHVNIYIPTKLTNKEKDAFKELASSEHLKPKGKHSDAKSKGFFSKVKDSFS
jgi:DnaJ-class molecular chaperone